MEARKNEAEKDKEKDHAVEIEYVTEEPEIYDPNYIFFKRIFEAFKVSVYVLPSRECKLTLKTKSRVLCASHVSAQKRSDC